MSRSHKVYIAFAVLSAACSPHAPASTVSMRMTGGPPNASVIIDDQFVGVLAVVAARGVALPPGTHHVTVEAAGYFPWDKTTVVNEGDGVVRFDVRLVPIPD
ncbi:MAG: PEGA domain-containing protein [Polyangiaceae bacterium]|nr:PEGA domain-containing protein [Polyangiaceae bacterium]